MNKIKHIVTAGLFFVSFIVNNQLFSQITAPTAISSQNTVYTNGATNDRIYIFCSSPSNPNTGSLTATPTGGTAPFTFSWYSYNQATNGWQTYSTTNGATSTINNLPSDGYFVTITDAGGNPAGCFRAWVFVNETTVDAGANIASCNSFNLNGTASPVANFVYYNPPPNPLVVNNTTQITVCFSATHTYVSDLGYFLVGPASCGSPTVTLAPNPAVIDAADNVCNGGDNVNNLCFSSTSTVKFDVCSAGTPVTGTFGHYGNTGSDVSIDWSPLYGCDAASGGWSVQIYDCIGADVGSLTNASISFNGNSSCGPLNINYTSGAINSAINDNSCDAASASIFTVPQNPATTTPITLTNTITSVQWSTGATTLNTSVNPAPSTDTWYYLTVTDNFGCTATDSVFFDNTCTCSIDNFSANQAPCENPANVYDVTGTVTFTNAPATGTLTVSSCSGQSQVFNAPFTSPQAYTLNNLPADGAACSVTAVFSADAACTQTINLNNQDPCDVPCFFTSIADTVGACDLVTNDFIRSGQVTFTNAPSTGTLTITDCLGNTQTFNAPFTSPTSYSLTINSNGTANCDITATFSADPACTINIAQSYPASCACPADAGTTSAGVFGSGLNDYILCQGDTIILVSDGNETNPNDVGTIGGSTYDPGITYGIYSCPPTPNTNPELDACFTGFVTGTIGSFGDINDGGLITFLNGQGVTLTNNIIYYAPITLYNQNDLVYNVNCVDVGSPIAVQYLPQVVSSNPTENCVAGTFTITINGGLPELDGSNFTASNLLPATASFVNTTTTNGGTIQITGLQHGDNYSFDVADANGCPITITGGPFTGAPVADAGQADTSCTLTYTLSATLSHGTGAWTGPANISFSNATSPTATATSTTAGTYTLTWTGTSIPGCTDVETVDITFLNPITTVVVPDCQDSSITVTISNGLPEQNGSNYTVSNLLPATANFTTSVATHAGDVVAQGLQDGDMYSFDITDDFGCTTSITGGPFVGLPIANAGQNDTSCTLTYNLNATPSIGTGLWTGPANISFTPNATSPTATATSTVTGTYTLTWTETNTPGCTDAQSIDITFTQMSIPNVLTNISCNGGNDGQIVVAPQGGLVPYSYAWSTSANNTPVENNLVAGNITVTVTDAAGCTLDSTFTLTQPAAFGLSITSTTMVTCNGGNDGAATANVSDVTDTYTYSWNTSPIQATATATGLSIGTYTVIATQVSSGCTDTTTVTITEPTAVTIATVSTDVTICSGQSTTITATATGGSNSGYTYTWNNGLGNGQNQTVTPAAGTTTTYQVTAVDANGCSSDMQDVAVTVHPNLSVIASVDDTICPGASAIISATPSFGNGGPYTYTWTPNTNISSTTAQSPTVTPTVTTTYTVTLSDGCSPTVTDQVTISLYNLPNPQATSDTLSLCIEPTQAITFYNTTDTTNGMLNPMAVVWDFGDGATATSPWDTISHTYTQPGTYAVSMTVSSMPSQGGCTVTQTVIPQINIYALPVADFTSDPNPTSMFEPEVQFADQSGSTIANWYWDFAGLDTSNYPNPLYAFPNDTLGTYPVTLIVTDIHGCQDEVTKNVIIKGEFGIYIPNAFTPDFDFKNDMFGPTGFGISPENYKFMIFDRWGEKLFDTDILFKPWDGFYKGTRVQEGVYVWKLFFKDINGKKHERIGHVTIIQ